MPPKAGASAKAKARGSRPKSTWFKQTWPRLLGLPKFGSAFTFLLVAAVISGQSGPLGQVARLLGAVAGVSEAVGNVATAALNSTSALVASASEVAVSMAVNSLNVGQNLWHGVDVFNISTHHCQGHVRVDSSAVLSEWFESHAAHMIWPCLNDHISSNIEAAVASISLQMPLLTSQTEDIVLAGQYLRLSMHADLTLFGAITVSFDYIKASFDTAWANSLWKSCGFHLGTERDQIRNALQLIAVKLTVQLRQAT